MGKKAAHCSSNLAERLDCGVFHRSFPSPDRGLRGRRSVVSVRGPAHSSPDDSPLFSVEEMPVLESFARSAMSIEIPQHHQASSVGAAWNDMGLALYQGTGMMQGQGEETFFSRFIGSNLIASST